MRITRKKFNRLVPGRLDGEGYAQAQMVQTATVTGWLDTESGEFFEDPVEREAENPTGETETYVDEPLGPTIETFEPTSGGVTSIEDLENFKAMELSESSLADLYDSARI